MTREKKVEDTPNVPRDSNALRVALLDLGWKIVAIFVVLVGGGRLLDRSFATDPMFTVILSVLAAVASFFFAIKISRQAFPNDKDAS